MMLAAFRYSRGRWAPGTLHEGLAGPAGAHREVGGGYGCPGAGEIVDMETGLPVYRTGVAGEGSGECGLGSSCVPEALRRAAGVPIRVYAPWVDPCPDAAPVPRERPSLHVFGVEIDPRYA